MGPKSKKSKAAAARIQAHLHAPAGKNPSVLDMKIEFDIHKLDYLDLRPNRNLTF